MADSEAIRKAAEDEVTAEVYAALRATADEAARQMRGADELTAAAWSVRSIATIWRTKVPAIMRRLFRTPATAAVTDTADAVNDGQVPAGYDDLAERYDTGTLPAALDGYTEGTEVLLNRVGEHLAERAARVLSQGLEAGDTPAELQARMAEFLSADGAFSEAKARQIGMTESTRAWNASVWASATAMTGPERPLVKQWRTQGDTHVRQAHRDANGQIQFLDDAFTVGEVAMSYPGDPVAPADLTVNCRCYLSVMADTTASVTAAAAPPHPGGMIALIPTAEDAERLAIEGGEDASELHCTLYFLTDDASEWDQEVRAAITAGVQARLSQLSGPVQGHLFGVNLWNPDSEDPAWVWPVGDAGDGVGLEAVRAAVLAALEDSPDRPESPVQHSPWVAHVTAQYGGDPSEIMASRIGDVTFDRVRVVFGGEATDIPLTPITQEGPPMADEEITAADPALYSVRTWSTPGDTALAFEDEQTGDGRVFAPDSLFWEDGPWPLNYCDAMSEGHSGGELAGSIQEIARDGKRITGTGNLYLSQEAGWEAAMLLDQEAPVGVSVDLDDVDMEVVAAPGTVLDPDEGDAPETGDEDEFRIKLRSLSMLPLGDGGWSMRMTRSAGITASGQSVVSREEVLTVLTASDGRIGRDVAARLIPSLAAAAGDPDPGADGEILETQKSGEYLMRITRARVRGATLVTLPAYSRARIVVDPETPGSGDVAATPEEVMAASTPDAYTQAVHAVWARTDAASSREIAEATGLPLATVRAHLKEAVEKGHLVKLGRRYTAPKGLPEGGLTAAASGDTSLPVAPRDTAWDGAAAAKSVFDWARDSEGNIDPGKAGAAFFYVDDNNNTVEAGYKLGFARHTGSGLEMVPEGVFAAAAAVQGARGGVDIPADQMDAVKSKIKAAYAHISEALDEEHTVPWEEASTEGLDGLDELEASAWTAMREMPPMPAAWFREPTAEELPPGSGGVHYKDGRVYGWVAQAGVPHASYGSKVTIDKIAAHGLDLTHFLRASFALDDGTQVRAGAFTMNVGHHRDGAECDTAACQFDDTRTVAGIVTVGMNAGGMWFSGAASPWVSEIDRRIMLACQPSYHMRQGNDGKWQLRAVLSVPMPGHSSPLVASFIERSNLTLTASAATVIEREAKEAAQAVLTVDTAAIVAALTDPKVLDGLAAALAVHQEVRAGDRARMKAEIDALAASVLGTKES